MRTIYVLVDPRTGSRPSKAFSHRRAADRYVDQIVKNKWKEAIDFERIGQERLTRITRYRRDYGETSYEYQREVQTRDQAMAAAASLVDAGYASFRQNYDYNYGSLPVVQEVKLYRTFADYTNEQQ